MLLVTQFIVGVSGFKFRYFPQSCAAMKHFWNAFLEGNCYWITSVISKMAGHKTITKMHSHDINLSRFVFLSLFHGSLDIPALVAPVSEQRIDSFKLRVLKNQCNKVEKCISPRTFTFVFGRMNFCKNGEKNHILR